MILTTLYYSCLLAFSGIDTNKIPDRCSQLYVDKNLITEAQSSTGQYHQYDEYLDLIAEKYKVLDCSKHEKHDFTYTDEQIDSEKLVSGIFLEHNSKCPGINHYLKKYQGKENKLSNRGKKLFKNLENQGERLHCDKERFDEFFPQEKTASSSNAIQKNHTHLRRRDHKY